MNDTNQNLTSRRLFIKSLAVLAGSSAIISSLPWIQVLRAETGNAAPSDRVRIGVIGTGSRGMYLMDEMLKIPMIELAALCDNYPPNLEAALAKTGGKAKTYEDHRKLLELKDIDAVVIATPLHEHAHIAIDALHAGKHVFCEKSMARTIDDCYRMAQAQKETGKCLHTGHQRLFSDRFLTVIDMVKSGDIGKIGQIRAYWHRNNDWRRPVPKPELERKINWRLYTEYSCGLMTELASHHLQVANWALDSVPEFVMGAGSINYWKDGREVYDNVNLVYGYPGGIHVLYDSMISNKHYGLEVQIMGDKGTIEPEIGKVYMETPPPAPGIVQLVNSIEQGVFSAVPIGGASWVPDLKSDTKGRYITDEAPTSDGSDRQMLAFAKSVHANKPIEGMLEHGYYATIATLMGLQAMDEKRIVVFPEECRL